MAQRAELKTTFEPSKVIQPFYSGGSVALGGDGQILATCLGDDVILTDLTSGEQLLRIEGDDEPITTISLTADVSYLITCSRSLAVRTYLLRSADGAFTAELQRTIKPHVTPTVTSAVDHTGTLFAAGAADGAIKIFDIRGGYTTHTFHGHSGVISALHFFEVADSKSDSKSQQDKKRKKRRSNGETMDIDDDTAEATFGIRIASGGEDGKVRIWDLHKRKSVAVLDSHVSVVRGLDFSAKENALVSGSRDKTVMLWDAKTWKIRSTIPILETIESVGFVQEGKYIYTGGENGQIRIWMTATGKEITDEQEPGGETEGVVDVLRPQNLSSLLSVHADQSLRLHSLDPLDETLAGNMISPLPVIRRISGTHDEVIDLAYIGLEKDYLALATNLEELRIISLSTRSPSALPSDHRDAVSMVPASHYFGADVTTLRGHTDIIITLDTDWSGHWLATGAKDNTARLWRLDPANNSYLCYATFSGHAESIGGIALPHQKPPSGSAAHSNPLDHPPKFLLTASQDKTIKRWDITTSSDAERGGRPMKVARAAYTRKAHDKDINALDTNPNDSLFASASQDRNVKIWDLEAGETIGILRGHKRGVWTAKFSPMGTSPITGESGATSSASRGYVVTGSADKSVRIWSLADYSCLRTFEGHTNSVLKVVWLPPSTTNRTDSGAHRRRGPQVASAGGDGLVKVWDIESESATTLDNHTDRVWALAVKPPRPSLPSEPRPTSTSTSDNPDLASAAADPESTAPNEEPTTLLSAGADAVLTFWRDTTHATQLATAAASTARLEASQTLANLARARAYGEGVALALRLEQPARLLQLLREATARHPAEEGSLTGLREVDDVIKGLGDEELWRLVLLCREWCVRGRNAAVGQRVLGAVVRLVEVRRLRGLRPPRGWGRGMGRAGGKKEGWKEVVVGLEAHSEKRHGKLGELRESAFVIGYLLQQIDEGMGMDGVNGWVGSHKGDGVGVLSNGVSKDVEMMDGHAVGDLE
ncbi:WD40 repeat-like protein [Viridothelium virens]|uniref:WD40 repeat-like protein n=1 Tax=Viridothelium virens TaxID=1048519 RepID=A0A6A6HMF8_VIRVR|nr:WD40 repeat-like protein [Viridothelium virens]